MNKVILIGRLCREPALSYTDEQRAICKITIAVDKPYSANRKVGDYTADFIDCVAFGSTGENIAKYFKTGEKIAISGRLSTSSYLKDDIKIKTYNIVIDMFDFCSSAR